MRHVGSGFAVALLLAPLARPGPSAADTDVTINTDRPAVTDSSVVVPAGALQVKTGVRATDRNGRYARDFPETLLLYGLFDKTELRLTVPDYYHNLPASLGSASGFGDGAIGVKQQLGAAAGFDVSLVAFVSLPTGAQSLTSHGYDPGMQLPWSHSLPAGWTVAGQFAACWPTLAGRRDATGEATVLIDRQLTAPWDAFLEYAADFPGRGGAPAALRWGARRQSP